MIEPGQHIVVFGISGCGKTTLTRLLSQCFKRKVIFDRLGEWVRSPEGYVARTLREFVEDYRKVYSEPEFTIVYRPEAGQPQEDLVAEVNQILHVIYQAESCNGHGIALIFEEVWLYAPIHATPPWFLETVLTGRHHKISVIGNSQRPANVSRTFTSQCRHVFIGQFYESVDKRYFKDTLAIDPEPPPRFEFLWYRPGFDLQHVSVSQQDAA